MVTVIPYLSFRGQAREALEFYQAALGGELVAMSFSSMPGAMGVEGPEAEWLMHGMLTVEDGQSVAAADMPSQFGEYIAPNGAVMITLVGRGPADLARLQTVFDKLSAGGTPGVPLELAPWGDHYGQFVDKYGVHWSIDVGPEA